MVEANFQALRINNLQEYEGDVEIDAFDDQISTTKIKERFVSSS